MDVLFTVVNDLKFFLELIDFVVEQQDFLAFLRHAEALAGISVLLLAVVVNLKNMKDLLLLVIFLSKFIQFLFVLADGAEKLCVSLFTGKELVDHFLNVAVACGCSYLLESIFQVTVLIHFIIHLLLKELTPEFLDLEVCPGPNFTLISVFIGSCFSDFLLLLHTIDSFLQCFFFILNTVLEANNSLVPFLLLVLDILHQIIQSVP